MHQFKIKGKMAVDGDGWQWRQDFGTWFNGVQMREARAMNVAIFLDAVNEFNGPLMFIPGSHKLGVLEAGHDTTTTSYPLWTIDKATITKLIKRGGLVAPKGPEGSMIMFHSCLVHASTSNLSPRRPGPGTRRAAGAPRRRRARCLGQESRWPSPLHSTRSASAGRCRATPTPMR